ncbi:hypothetical protein BDW62DRAFT_186285 [Aspergillus aurantiobrunneus]
MKYAVARPSIRIQLISNHYWRSSLNEWTLPFSIASRPRSTASRDSIEKRIPREIFLDEVGMRCTEVMHSSPSMLIVAVQCRRLDCYCEVVMSRSQGACTDLFSTPSIGMLRITIQPRIAALKMVGNCESRIIVANLRAGLRVYALPGLYCGPVYEFAPPCVTTSNGPSHSTPGYSR